MRFYSGWLNPSGHTRFQSPSEPLAGRCNSVAAAALMPRDVLSAQPRVTALGPRSTKWTDAEISELARDFNVSREALLRRLLTFDRTTEEFYRQKRAQ
jgi:Zn-dependent peptidase ImmA (M78 family)